MFYVAGPGAAQGRVMILISGASGTVGRHVVRLLVDRGVPVRALTRDPARMGHLPGVEVVRGDLGDPPSLAGAVAGVEAVFLLTAPPTPAADHDLVLLDAARAAGVGRIVKLSAIGTGERFAEAEVGAWHRVAEDAVRASGARWTVLRPSSFATNLLGAAHAAGPVPDLTGPGRQGVVDPLDVAAVAVEALIGAGHDGRTHTLTGPEPLTFRDQLDVLERVLGRAVPSVDQSLDAARRELVGHGVPAAAVDAMLLGVGWARAGHNAVVTDDVPRILGRPARSFETWARAALTDGAG
jgi:uncharacterized protein YbjT (DUF2867 family)